METSYHNRKGNGRWTIQPEKGCEFPIVFMWNLRRGKDKTSTSKTVYYIMYYYTPYCFICRYLYLSKAFQRYCVISMDSYRIIQKVQRYKDWYKKNINVVSIICRVGLAQVIDVKKTILFSELLIIQNA